MLLMIAGRAHINGQHRKTLLPPCIIYTICAHVIYALHVCPRGAPEILHVVCVFVLAIPVHHYGNIIRILMENIVHGMDTSYIGRTHHLWIHFDFMNTHILYIVLCILYGIIRHTQKNIIHIISGKRIHMLHIYIYIGPKHERA